MAKKKATKKRDGSFLLGGGMAQKAAQGFKGRQSRIDAALRKATGGGRKKK